MFSSGNAQWVVGPAGIAVPQKRQKLLLFLFQSQLYMGTGGRCPCVQNLALAAPSMWRPPLRGDDHKPTRAFICGNGWGGRRPLL